MAEENLSLEKVLDIEAFQDLSESFTRLTGVATAIIGLDGTILTRSGWQRICTDFHRKHPETAAKCQKSDTILAQQTGSKKKYNIYKCENGLIDVAVPIIIDNTHVGNLFTGQFFLEPPDREFFARKAERFGFNKDSYLESIEEVPLYSKEQVEQAVDFLLDLTVIIGNAGLDKLKLHSLNQELEKRIEERTAAIKAERTFSESLINSLPGIMYVFDKLGRFKKWNENFETVTGYSPEQIKNINPLDLFASAKEKSLITAAIDKVFRQGSATIEADFLTIDGRKIPYLFTGYHFTQNHISYLVGVGLDISDRVKTEKEKEVLINKLEEMLSQVKQLSGFLPICASCKNIRDDEGYWNQIEAYIQKHSEAEFSHSICPECAKKLYPDIDIT